MARKIMPERLPEIWAEIIEEYKDDIVNACDDVTREMGRKTAAAVRNSAKAVYKGKYPGSWTFTVEGRYHPTAIIYSRIPGLPHLLEHGHATTKGGRVPGKPHIKPVEEKAVNDFERILIKALESKG